MEVSFNMIGSSMKDKIFSNLHIIWLSTCKIVTHSLIAPISCKKVYNHVASLAPSVIAQYSTSVEEKATFDCFQEHQMMGLNPNLNM
jgi:hypothetical protein